MFSKTDIEHYFIAEKQESLFFLIIGIAAILLSVFFYAGLKTNFYKGAAIPILVFGLLMCIVGCTVYKKSDADRLRNVYAFDMNPTELKEKEIPRMERIVKNFIWLHYVEAGLLIAGICLFFYFKNNQTKSMWQGFGIALVFISIIALSADYIAAKRGMNYLNGLKFFIENRKGH